MRPLFIVSIAVIVSRPAPAEESCDVAQPMDAARVLRRLSLDLRGRVPSYSEALEVRGRAEVPDSAIDNYLGSSGFDEVLRQYHESLLWPNLREVQLLGDTQLLAPGFFDDQGVFHDIWWSPLRGVFMRTAPDGALFVPCKAEPARFDAGGELIVEDTIVNGELVAHQEGYVELEPYWAPGTRVRVCGMDAQPALTAGLCPGPAGRYPFTEPICDAIVSYAGLLGVPGQNAPYACNGPWAPFVPGCGCGPSLNFCATGETLATLQRSLADQQLRLIQHVVDNDLPYFDILTSPRLEVNGPIAHYLRYQSRQNLDLFNEPDATMPLPDGIGWTSGADSWVVVSRSGRHAGVLTMPGFLLRFASNRGRAHRFYEAFECSSFLPNGPLPSPFAPCSQHEDLTQRCGCNACHTTLEPLAAHWGRFAEYGFGQLDELAFPKQRGASCAPPYASLEQFIRCDGFYENDPVGDEVPFAGYLRGYVFRTAEQSLNVDQGPRRLVDRALTDDKLAPCAVRRLWSHFMRRLPTADEELTVVPELVGTFRDADYALKPLVKAIVKHPAYRRAP